MHLIIYLGKKNEEIPTAVCLEASRSGLNIPILTPDSGKDEDFLATVEGLKPDLCITAAYGNYLPKKFLNIPVCGTVNLHPSLLPKYRGAAPIQRCLENGDLVTGITLLYSVLKMDAGKRIYGALFYRYYDVRSSFLSLLFLKRHIYY